MWVMATPPQSCSVNISSNSSVASTAEVTVGHDMSSFFSRGTADDSREECVAASELPAKHWVRVLRLDSTTTAMQLQRMFYPHGGDDAIIVASDEHVGNSSGNSGIVGFVSFEAREMAALAVEKMDAFVPCGQTQALRVCAVTREYVAAAQQRSTMLPTAYHSESTRAAYADVAAATTTTTTTTTAAEANAAAAAAFVQQLQHCTPDVLAVELADDVRKAEPATLTRIVAMLAQLPQTWPARESFFDALLKQLLCRLLDRTACNVMQAANCGAVAGSLFARGFLPGDPFQLASQLLQHGVCNTAQVEGICAIAHVCDALPSATMSRAAFWALVSRTATHVDDVAVRTALLAHLRQLGANTQSAVAPPPPPYTKWPAASSSRSSGARGEGRSSHHYCHQSSGNSSSSDSSSSSGDNNDAAVAAPGSGGAASLTSEHVLLQQQQRQQDEAKRRTVYLSHLPPALPQQTLMKLLTCAGPVNKVRVCAGSGYSTLFAFVEMRTLQGAKACMRLNDMCVLDHRIRVQSARNAIQDVVGDDAVYGFAGTVVQPCLFGSTDDAIADSVSTTPPR